ERVDGPAYPYSTAGEPNFEHIALLLDPSANNRPTVVFTASTSTNSTAGVGIAARGGANQWATLFKTFSLPSQYYTMFAGGAAISSTGLVHFTFGAEYNTGYTVTPYYANSATTSTGYAVLSGDGNGVYYDGRIPLALDSSGDPLTMDGTYVSHLHTGGTTLRSQHSVSSQRVIDLTYANGKPTIAMGAAVTGGLEMATPDASGYWVYTQVGSVDTSSAGSNFQYRVGVAVDGGGTSHVCFRRNGQLTYQ
ncbi:MAG: hypothetical protein JST92_25075, partial [Deltaproteobacteria bacterium]|nr:hypothetical protein [Deltaproteobacteria bacterium]